MATPPVWDVTPSEGPQPRAFCPDLSEMFVTTYLFSWVQGRQEICREWSVFLKAQLTSARLEFRLTWSRFQQPTLFMRICTSKNVLQLTFTLAHSNVYFPVVIKQQTTVTDKVKHRLEDLNDFEEVTDLTLLHYVVQKISIPLP